MIPKEQSPKFVNITTGLKNNACVLYAVDEIGNVWEYTSADGWHILEMTRILS